MATLLDSAQALTIYFSSFGFNYVDDGLKLKTIKKIKVNHN